MTKLVDMTGNEIRVYQYLKKGRKNRCTRDYLVAKTGMTDRRVREAVHTLRAKGVPICSVTGKPGGYWICNNADELKQFISELHVQRDQFSKAILRLEKFLKGSKNGKLLF